MASSSKWSSYFQQTLAGVESRLDTILVGDEPPKQAPPAVKPVPTDAGATKIENGQPKSSVPPTTTNDRLQERLARAIAAKNYAAQKALNQTSSVDSSRATTPAPATDSPRASSEIGSVVREELKQEHDEPPAIKTEEPATEKSDDPTADLSKDSSAPAAENSTRSSIDVIESTTPRKSADSTRLSTELSTGISTGDGATATEEPSARSSVEQGVEEQQRLEAETVELQRQEELHGYVERIDALQAKLQYLSREAVESARRAAADSSSDSPEKKLAEKDEQIALLLEEGQRLSKTELKHMTVIKGLRSKASIADKEVLDSKQRAEKLEKEKSDLTDRLKRSDMLERQLNQRQKQFVQAQKEVDALKVERGKTDTIITELKTQLAEATSQVKANEVKAANEALEREKKRIVELENDISSLKIEKELAAGRAKVQMDELRSKHEREVERARVAEIEMKAEQQMLESRLEMMRTHAEEVSTGTGGDAQVKLLRQIETLQSQYAVATDNWQGIEASLTSRATSLEQERDEAMRREVEVRRKAREITIKAKRNEDDLEDKRLKIDSLEQNLSSLKDEINSIRSRAETAEAGLTEATRTHDQQKLAWKGETQQRLEEERAKWREDTQSSFGITRADSPITTSNRGLTAEFLGLQNLQNRRASSRSMTNETPTAERRVSRKSSVQPLRSSGRATPVRQDSAQSIVPEDGEGMETPSIMHTTEPDDYFDNVMSPSSPHAQTHDVLSISTVGAGPSVQLVERMSANVRRLESEKVSTKEELARLSTQRDEARAQIMQLRQDAAARMALEKRVKEMEEENERVEERYQTTLEMLGEKSEMVDELRADVQDLKDMYRELVERTVK